MFLYSTYIIKLFIIFLSKNYYPIDSFLFFYFLLSYRLLTSITKWMKVKIPLNLFHMIRSNYFICISSNFYFWKIRRQTFIFRRKIWNNADWAESILSLLHCTEVSGNGIISNPEASLLCFHIGLEWEPLAVIASHSHRGGAGTQQWSICPRSVFFIFNRKVILSASLEMFIGTCGFYIWLSFLRVCVNQTIDR